MPIPMSQIVDSVIGEVYGYSQTVDTSTYSVGSLTSTGLNFALASGKNFSRGLIQIGDELVIPDSVDRETGAVTLGSVQSRGVRGTVPEAHPSGTLVTMAPTIPRSAAKRAINETIQSSGGLWATSEIEFKYNYPVVAYPIPDDADDILGVYWFPTGPTRQWLPVRRWTHDKYNKLIVLGDAIQPGRMMRVTYTHTPTVPDDDGTFEDTGLPASCVDVIRFGAAWRVVSMLESFNLMAQSAEADAMDRQNTPGSMIRVGQYFYQLYQQRLREELGSLQARHPVRVKYEGRY